MDIACRPARPEDLDAAARIVQQAYNDLRVRHGLAPTVPLRPPMFQAFCLAQDPDGLWVAETGGAVVGFGFAWMRQRFWFLAQLFAEPGAQAKGVGRALLSKTFEHAERNGAENRALITMAYNTASIGLYVRNGLYPREPLFRVVAPAPAIARHIAAADHEAVPIAPWPEPREWLGQIDDEVLGFRREEYHAFLLGGPAARAVRIVRAGCPAGYAYISAEGHIGPLAIAPGAGRRREGGSLGRAPVHVGEAAAAGVDDRAGSSLQDASSANSDNGLLPVRAAPRLLDTGEAEQRRRRG
jgi:GNAT superfamily N-acetyltransferase